MKKRCFFLDVFTDSPLGGNPLAVFPDGDNVSDEAMLKLAQEINYSEITFILPASGSEADFNIKIFTPALEIPFAGHPTIGTAYAVDKRLKQWPPEKPLLRLKQKAGIIPVYKEPGENGADIYYMIQNQPSFGYQMADHRNLATALSLPPEEIDSTIPIIEVSTGIPFIIVPIKTLAAIEKIQIIPGLFKPILKDFTCRDILCFSRGARNPWADLHIRLFAPELGIYEDPATGSAAGCLLAYLLKYNIMGKKLTLKCEQGIEMGRPSRIYLKGEITGDLFTINVGGGVHYIGDAYFYL